MLNSNDWKNRKEAIDTGASTERNAAPRHDLEQSPRFILSESFIAISVFASRACALEPDGIPEESFIVPGARAERTSTTRICNKEDRCDGRNIASS